MFFDFGHAMMNILCISYGKDVFTVKRHPNRIGFIISCVGVLIILALILPSAFWWFTLGTALILIGIFVAVK